MYRWTSIFEIGKWDVVRRYSAMLEEKGMRESKILKTDHAHGYLSEFATIWVWDPIIIQVPL